MYFLGILVISVIVEFVFCFVLFMIFFDRLIENNVVRESGYISKCFDEFCGEFIILDELRKVRYVYK